MTNSTNRTTLLALSERAYRTLLFLYPAEYRRDYGAPMTQLFRDVCRDTYLTKGSVGIALWWCTTLLDLTLTVIEQRRKVRFTMSRSTLIQFTGILLIVGGACGMLTAFSQLQPGSHYSYYGIYQIATLLVAPAFLLIGLGNFGFALRYGAAAGAIGRWALIAAGIGGLVMAVGFALSFAIDALWAMAMVGLYIYTIGGAVFGLVNLRVNIVPAYRALPLVASIFPLLAIFGVGRTGAEGGSDWMSFAWLVVMSAIWFVIGVAIQRQQFQRVAAAA